LIDNELKKTNVQNYFVGILVQHFNLPNLARRNKRYPVFIIAK